MKTFLLSNAQIRMLTTELRNPQTSAYVFPIHFSFDAKFATHILPALKLVSQGNLLLRLGKSNSMDFFQYYAQPDDSCFVEHDMTQATDKELSELTLSLSTPSLPKLFDAPLFKFDIVYTKNKAEIFLNVSHHILDGTSANIFAVRLQDCIDSLSASKDWEPPEENYTEYVEFEKKYTSSKQAEIDKQFWLKELGDTDEYPEAMQLTDDMKISHKLITIPADTAKKLMNIKDSKGKVISPFITLSGLFAIYVARSRRSKGTIITAGYAARDFENGKIKNMIGMFVNVLPLNFRYNPEQTLHQQLISAKETVKNGLIHGKLSLNTYSNELSKNDFDINSLFNYSIVSNSTPTESNPSRMQIGYSTENEFPLTIRVNCNKNDKHGLQTLRLEYRNDCFSRNQIDTICDNLLALINDASQNPDKKCKELCILSEKEKKLLLNTFQGKKIDYDTNKTIIDTLKSHSEQNGDQIAIQDINSHITYRQTESYTNSLAVILQKKGVKTDNFVAVMLPRTKEFVLAALSVMKSGGAYVPVDYAYPRDRISYMVNDSNARIIITTKEILKQTELKTDAEILFIDDFNPDNEKPQSLPVTNQLAYMIYTSGSTGNPKGVMIEHKSAAAMCNWVKDLYNLTPGNNTFCYASFSFDASVIDIFPSLYSGCTLHVLNDELRFDMGKLSKYMADNKMKFGCFPTKFGMEFLQECDPELEFVIVGGEKLKQMPKRKTAIINGYGPTEFTVASSFHVVDQDKLYSNIPIGKPVANSYSYVVDSNNQLVPVGTPGELMLAGRQISRGYYNREQLTSDKFVSNPYSNSDENKLMYHTGDLVCWNEQGELEFLGRIDSQIKLRGYRIELGEIETTLNNFTQITNSVALVKNDSLIAYYTAKTEIDKTSLKNTLAEKMPAYMVPSYFIQLPQFPMTPGGKTDLKKLPAPQHEETINEEKAAPQTQKEKEIFDIIARILKHNEFGVTTNLFQAGMSSLDAIKIASRISEYYLISFNAQKIMSGKTIRSIENALLADKGNEVKTYKKQQDYPLTQSQMGIYYECAKDPQSLKYNIPFSVKLSTEIDANKLIEAIKTVLNKHPYIKTCLCMKGQQVRQKRNDDAPIIVEHKSGSDTQLQTYKENFLTPFRLFTGPIYRICVFSAANSVNIIADFHHIIFDGASIDIMLSEIQKVYSGKDITSEVFSSFEMSLEQQEAENTQAYKNAQSYFEEHISKCESATMLPPDKNENENEGNLCQETIQIEKEQILSLCKNQGVTVGNLFLAAVSYTISRFANTSDILISTISNGRSDSRYEKNFGMLVRTLPLVLNINSDSDIQSYIHHAHEAMISTISHECYPFTKVSEKFKFSPQLMYAFQSGVVSDITIGNDKCEIETLELKKPKFKLSIHIQDSNDNYEIAIQYNNALYTKELMQRLAECIQIVVKHFITDTGKKLSSVSIVSGKQQQLLEKFNQTSTKLPTELLHKMFEKVVDEKPEQIALIACDETLSYNKLNQRANRIASALLEKGLKIEDRVAFILHRDSRLISAMLGIVKAGGAYIPVDPEYPAERIRHVIEDSDARYVICNENTKELVPTEKQLDVDLLLKNSCTDNPNICIEPGNLCYLIYTSGSTGKPKGVMLTHRGICNYVTSHPKNSHVYQLVNKCNTMLSITTVSFDMFLKESFTSLMNGLTLAFASEEQCQNPLKLAGFFRQTSADAFNATPSRMMQYLQSAQLQKAIGRCKVLMAGGETFPEALYTQLKKHSDAQIFNTYGPTEITVSSNAKKLENSKITIGAPLLNVKEYVMDSDSNPLPTGVMGELYIGGYGVARGYWNSPEKTEDKFVNINGERLYKTGDYARWSGDGEIIISGRTDNQIKLRGLRIELGEIESAIAAYEGIRSAVATIRKIQGSDHICAYYTADADIKTEKLRNFLSEKLTKYMVPTAYMQLKTMPTTPNGKTDIKSLPEPVMMAQNEYVAPKNDMEQTFCDIFASILKITKVGAQDNFFDSGGTSLLVTQVTIDAMNEGYEISYGDVFTNPSPEELAVLVKTRAEETVERPVIKKDEVENININPRIDAILKQNTAANFDKSKQRPLGNLLLTGSTGFLGIHVLKSFLENETGVVYCMMRSNKNSSLEERLKGLLVYYFENSFDELFKTRIIPVEANVTSAQDFAKLQSCPVDTVINCAANVKHYAAGSQIRDVNVLGVKNGIDFCLKKGCRYIQISTTSVAGLSIEDYPPPETKFDEQTLFIGQNMENKYISSKFEAEKLVLQAINNGLDGKIMRAGNLMARNRDGEFQINFNTNGFVNRLKAYNAIGCISYQAMALAAELAPIDCTADSIIKLATAPSECCVFHPYNNHFIYIGDIIKIMNDQGLKVKPVDEATFQQAFSQAMKDKNKAPHLAGIIAYLNMGNGKKVSTIHTINNYTVQILFRYNFQWPITSDEYLVKFIGSLKDLAFFDWQETCV